MFGLNYLPEKDISQQIELQEELKLCRDPTRFREINEELAALNAKRKPIIECNIEEATELKALIHRKLQLVSSTGKRTQAMQFTTMIQVINDRIAVLHLQAQKEEQKKNKEVAEKKEERKAEAKELTRELKEGNGVPRARSSKNRWTTGFGKID